VLRRATSDEVRVVRKASTLALGVDLGAARTRVALLERDSAGVARLVAVASRPTGGDPGLALAEAWAELGTAERRCVVALGHPDTLLRTAAFPRMGRGERARAARFEAARFVSYPIAEAAVRVTPCPDGTAVIGVAHRPALEARLAAARRARLTVIAVDDIAFALRRALPHADAVVDVGEDRATLVVAREPIPVVRSFEIGGRALTYAIAESLGIDMRLAEERKHSIGLAGAGEHARDALVAQLAAALLETRAAAQVDLRGLALAGNGSRLAGLPEALERAVQIPVRAGTLAPDASLVLPADVVRSASPDWAAAYGLALWETAA
jgi:Tfp pilus assembly PilM family ATPase